MDNLDEMNNSLDQIDIEHYNQLLIKYGLCSACGELDKDCNCCSTRGCGDCAFCCGERAFYGVDDILQWVRQNKDRIVGQE